MRTQRRRRPWTILAGLFIMGALGCQTITYVDRSLIPDGGGGGAGGAGGGGGAGGKSDAGDQ
jgi:hypothetical protein